MAGHQSSDRADRGDLALPATPAKQRRFSVPDEAEIAERERIQEERDALSAPPEPIALTLPEAQAKQVELRRSTYSRLAAVAETLSKTPIPPPMDG